MPRAGPAHGVTQSEVWSKQLEGVKQSNMEKQPQLALGTPGRWGELLALGRKQRLEAGGLSSPEGEEACVLEASGS